MFSNSLTRSYIDSNIEEISSEIETLAKFSLKKEVLLHFYHNYSDLFKIYCENTKKIGNETEKVLISGNLLPVKYYENNWVYPENLAYLIEICSVEEIETFFSKEIPNSGTSIFMYMDFICENNFSADFWKLLAEKTLSMKDGNLVVNKVKAHPKALKKFIEAGYPLEKLIS
ncbi:MAG: hypothetical protein ACK5N8_06315 [Alphaproteobacteria bacterium]